MAGAVIGRSSDNSAARLQMNILMAVAEFERDIIRERTLAGLAAAQARGTKLGRPSLQLSTKATKILRRFMHPREKSPRPSYRSLAAELEVSVGKAHALTRGLAQRRKSDRRK